MSPRRRRLFTSSLLLSLAMWITATASVAPARVPKIWYDAFLADWATPIAALQVRPKHFTAAEYYSVPADNLRTYPVYRPDRVVKIMGRRRRCRSLTTWKTMLAASVPYVR